MLISVREALLQAAALYCTLLQLSNIVLYDHSPLALALLHFFLFAYTWHKIVLSLSFLFLSARVESSLERAYYVVFFKMKRIIIIIIVG